MALMKYPRFTRLTYGLALGAIAAACGGHTLSDLVAAGLLTVSGDNQTAAPSAALPLPLIVRVISTDSVPVEGIAVTWAVTTGGGLLGHLHDTTNANGEISNTWT